MWIGSNDILLLNEDKPGNSAKNIQSEIQTLISSTGATRFLVANMPDVTVTPGYLAYDSYLVAESVRAEARAKIQKRVIKFNDKLDKALYKIEKKNPGVEIFRFDTFSLLNDILAHPDDYGVNPNTDIPLMDEQALFIDGELVFLQPAKDPLPLFWDGVHPTSSIHDIFADAACRALERCD